MKDEIAGVIFDLDGVLEFQGKAYPGAIELLDSLRRRGTPIRVLSNSTLKSRRSCTEQLNKGGFAVYQHELYALGVFPWLHLSAVNLESLQVH